MRLDCSQIISTVQGAAYWEETDGRILLHRFTKEQKARYEATDAGDALRSRSTSGIVLRFYTNSQTLSLAINVTPGSSRTFFAVDVLENGIFLGSIDNLADAEHRLGMYEKTFTLQDSETLVEIVLPWSVKADIMAVELEDGASFRAAPYEKRLLAYGDSITQGYDARHPMNRYTAALCRKYAMEERCKAIGGAHFTPWLAESVENYTPDLITIAYGTNDWYSVTQEKLAETATAFLAALRNQHPTVPIVLLSPIARIDTGGGAAFGSFEAIAPILQEAAACFRDVYMIDCIGFLEKESAIFSPDGVHPNEEGMQRYGAAFCEAMEKLNLNFGKEE